MDTTILHYQEGRDKPDLPKSREECHSRIIKLQFDIAAIRDQLATADMERQANGGRIDTDWFRRARASLRFKREELVLIQDHIRSTAAANKAKLKDAIIAIVRRDYDADEWRGVLDEAHRQIREGGA